MSRARKPRVAVVGGAVAGLAAAERFAGFASVDLFERQSYAKKRVNCGEAINDVSVVPLEPTRENGFLNPVEGFDVRVYASTDRAPEASPLANPLVRAEDCYIADRDVLERRWADRLDGLGVDVRDGTNVTRARYRELLEEYDHVVDATGQPSLTAKVEGWADRYGGSLVALNADVEREGAFAGFVDRPRIAFEGYTGYWWCFPKSASRANVGIGWTSEERPGGYLDALTAACERAGVPVPEREAVSVYTIPEGPSLDTDLLHPRENVFLVGDAAGIANRYQGEGIVQAIRSSYLLAELLREGRAGEYPRRLHERMRPEFRLAHLMRGVWEESADPELLAAVAQRLDGLTVEEVTRQPRTVLRRVLERPGVTLDLLGVPGLRRRVLDVAAGRWDRITEGQAGAQG